MGKSQSIPTQPDEFEKIYDSISSTVKQYSKPIYTLAAADHNVKDEWQQRLRQAKEKETGERLILIPYSVKDLHWIGVILKFDADEQIEWAEYFDPVVQSDLDLKKLQTEFYEVYSEVVLQRKEMQIQDDSKSSFDLTIEYLLKAAEEAQFDKVKSPIMNDSNTSDCWIDAKEDILTSFVPEGTSSNNSVSSTTEMQQMPAKYHVPQENKELDDQDAIDSKTGSPYQPKTRKDVPGETSGNTFPNTPKPKQEILDDIKKKFYLQGRSVDQIECELEELKKIKQDYNELDQALAYLRENNHSDIIALNCEIEKLETEKKTLEGELTILKSNLEDVTNGTSSDRPAQLEAKIKLDKAIERYQKKEKGLDDRISSLKSIKERSSLLEQSQSNSTTKMNFLHNKGFDNLISLDQKIEEKNRIVTECKENKQAYDFSDGLDASAANDALEYISQCENVDDVTMKKNLADTQEIVEKYILEYGNFLDQEIQQKFNDIIRIRCVENSSPYSKDLGKRLRALSSLSKFESVFQCINGPRKVENLHDTFINYYQELSREMKRYENEYNKKQLRIRLHIADALSCIDTFSSTKLSDERFESLYRHYLAKANEQWAADDKAVVDYISNRDYEKAAAIFSDNCDCFSNIIYFASFKRHLKSCLNKMMYETKSKASSLKDNIETENNQKELREIKDSIKDVSRVLKENNFQKLLDDTIKSDIEKFRNHMNGALTDIILSRLGEIEGHLKTDDFLKAEESMKNLERMQDDLEGICTCESFLEKSENLKKRLKEIETETLKRDFKDIGKYSLNSPKRFLEKLESAKTKFPARYVKIYEDMRTKIHKNFDEAIDNITTFSWNERSEKVSLLEDALTYIPLEWKDEYNSRIKKLRGSLSAEVNANKDELNRCLKRADTDDDAITRLGTLAKRYNEQKLDEFSKILHDEILVKLNDYQQELICSLDKLSMQPVVIIMQKIFKYEEALSSYIEQVTKIYKNACELTLQGFYRCCTIIENIANQEKVDIADTAFDSMMIFIRYWMKLDLRTEVFPLKEILGKVMTACMKIHAFFYKNSETYKAAIRGRNITELKAVMMISKRWDEFLQKVKQLCNSYNSKTTKKFLEDLEKLTLYTDMRAELQKNVEVLMSRLNVELISERTRLFAEDRDAFFRNLMESINELRAINSELKEFLPPTFDLRKPEEQIKEKIQAFGKKLLNYASSENLTLIECNQFRTIYNHLLSSAAHLNLEGMDVQSLFVQESKEKILKSVASLYKKLEGSISNIDEVVKMLYGMKFFGENLSMFRIEINKQIDEALKEYKEVNGPIGLSQLTAVLEKKDMGLRIMSEHPLLEGENRRIRREKMQKQDDLGYILLLLAGDDIDVALKTVGVSVVVETVEVDGVSTTAKAVRFLETVTVDNVVKTVEVVGIIIDVEVVSSLNIEVDGALKTVEIVGFLNVQVVGFMRVQVDGILRKLEAVRVSTVEVDGDRKEVKIDGDSKKKIEVDRVLKMSKIDGVLKLVKIDGVLKTVEIDGALKVHHETFRKKYDELLSNNLRLLNEKNQEEPHFELLIEITKCLVDTVAGNTISAILNQAFKEKIPQLLAHIFAIWTLKNTVHYNAARGIGAQQAYLLVPHVAQVIAIFRILGIGYKNHQASENLKNLVEIGTGEGKSVVMAITACVFALIGVDVSCSCYSEVLSKRDAESFASLFRALKIEEHIEYGTFNKLCENLLNEQCNVREKVCDTILKNKNALDVFVNVKHVRPKVLLIDEVDVFLSEKYYGGIYTPVVYLKHPIIKSLLDAIWENRTVRTLNGIKAMPAYQACAIHFSNWMFLFDEAVKDMIVALQSFQPSTYIVQEDRDRIVYIEGESIAENVVRGYDTIWAYYHENKNDRITLSSLVANVGIIISCGTFSYAEMPHEFAYITGVTGTLRTLAPPEQNILKRVYEIHKNTFMPSVFGSCRRNYNCKTDVRVVNETEYFMEIRGEIDVIRNASRAILVFFESEEKLMMFHDSSAMSLLKQDVQLITEKVSIEDRDVNIKRSATIGKVTLLTRTFGRGTDFVCNNQQLLANGGIHVLQTFFSEELSEECQIMGRGARQGDSGSYRMILLDKDLEWVLGSSWAAELPKISGATLYENLNKSRNARFESKCGAKGLSIEHCKREHTASKGFMTALNSGNIGAVKEFLKNQNQGENLITASSRTVLLMDATGSMSSLLSAAKETVCTMFERAADILKKKGLPSDVFQMQFAIYRNYNSRENEILQISPWSTKGSCLRAFMDTIGPEGGWGNEAIEIGLWHAVKESDRQESVSQVILIGDAPANSQAEVSQKRASFREEYWKTTKFSAPTYYATELQKLNAKKIPIHAFYLTPSAETNFVEIARETGGRCEALHIQSSQGAEWLTHFVTEEILRKIDVHQGDVLVEEYRKKYVKGFTS